MGCSPVVVFVDVKASGAGNLFILLSWSESSGRYGDSESTLRGRGAFDRYEGRGSFDRYGISKEGDG